MCVYIKGEYVHRWCSTKFYYPLNYGLIVVFNFHLKQKEKDNNIKSIMRDILRVILHYIFLQNIYNDHIYFLYSF